MIEINVQSRLVAWPLSPTTLRKAARFLCNACFPGEAAGEISIALISSRRMARLNHAHLRHTGPTDVITFDYSGGVDGGERLAENAKAIAIGSRRLIFGEIFVCPEVASKQCVEFRVSWEAEVLRYLAHGFLHLSGHDDLDPARRRVMKRAENSLVRRLERALRD